MSGESAPLQNQESTPVTGQQSVTPPTGGTPPTDFRSSLPEAYREKPYLRDAKSMEDVLKQLDGAQSLIGKKSVPGPDAKPEEWEQFYSSAGRPESADKYDIKRADGINVAPELDKQVRQALFAAGLSARQVQTLVPAYDKIMMEASKAHQEAEMAAFDKEFDGMATEVFGDKRDEELKAAQILLNDLVPEQVKKFLPDLDSQSMVILASVMREVRNKYVGEDNKRLQGGNSTGGESVEQLREKVRAVMSNPAFSQNTHPDHDRLVREKNELYSRIHQMMKK